MVFAFYIQHLTIFQHHIISVYKNFDLASLIILSNMYIIICNKIYYLCKKVINNLFSVPPIMTIQNQLVGAKEGDSVHLDCHSEAFPRSINYWTINDQIISQSECFFTIISFLDWKEDMCILTKALATLSQSCDVITKGTPHQKQYKCMSWFAS